MEKVVVFLVAVAEVVYAFKFMHVTDEVRLQDTRGQVAAYGDFNGDKAVDILVLSDDRSRKYTL